MMVVSVCDKSGWYHVSFDRMIIAKFLARVDANIYVLCCINLGHTKHAKLASGLIV